MKTTRIATLLALLLCLAGPGMAQSNARHDFKSQQKNAQKYQKSMRKRNKKLQKQQAKAAKQFREKHGMRQH